jgi:hypothetical protein
MKRGQHAKNYHHKKTTNIKDRNKNPQLPPLLPVCSTYIPGALEHWCLWQVSILVPHPVSHPLSLFHKSQQHLQTLTQTSSTPYYFLPPNLMEHDDQYHIGNWEVTEGMQFEGMQLLVCFKHHF